MKLSLDKKSNLVFFLKTLAIIVWVVSLMVILTSCHRGEDSSEHSNSTNSSGHDGVLIVNAHDVKSANADNRPASSIVEPRGKFIYVANYDSNNVSAFAIDVNTNVLTEVVRSPFAAGDGPVAIAVDPNGKFIFVANLLSNNISAYKIDASTGALTPVDRAPFATGRSPQAITVDPSGKFIYVTNYDSDTISAFTIDNETGALTPVDESPFTANSP